MKRLLLLVLLAAICAGQSRAETLRERYWRLHRERNATTRYGTPPRASVTNGLPAGCRLLEYVESTGEQYVDTGISAAAPIVADVLFEWKQASIGQDNYIFGRSGSGDTRLYFGTYQSKWMLGYKTYSQAGTPMASTKYHAEVVLSNGVQKLVVNGTTMISTTKTGSLSLSGTMPLFARLHDGVTDRRFYSKTKLYNCKILSGSTVRDYIPVKDANGVAGLWDRISGQVFYSATETPLVAGPERLTPAVEMAPSDVSAWLAPPPGSGEVTDGDLWLDCLAIPEGNWLCECPVDGTGSTVWRAALCPSNILAAVVWRHAVGLAPTNLPVTLEHDPSRVIGRIERLYYEAGTGVVARISITQAGYDWAVSNHCTKPSPDTRCFTTGTNVAIRTDGWIHEHQDYIEARCVPRGEDMSSVTNVPAGVQAIVMAPVYLRGLSLVGTPLLPTYIEQRVPDHLRDVYPLRPPRQWDWRNGY